MASTKKISIITVCFNAAECIEAAIQSVLSQTYKNIEYIVIDGKSTDGTIDIINTYKERIARIISEQDGGIYDAMNKGIRMASGDVLYFLNADDVLFGNDTIEKAMNVFDDGLDILYGKVSGKNIPSFKSDFNYDAAFTGQVTSKKDILKTTICHQRIFARKKIFNRTGLFDTRYKIHADFDWLLKIFNNRVKIKFLNEYVAYFNCEGLSHNDTWRTKRDKVKIVLRNSSVTEIGVYLFYRLYNKFRRFR